MDLEQSRNFEDALDLWETISSISGPTREILLGRGRCLREQRMFAEADQALRHAMSCFPGDPEIEANFAQVAAVAGDWPEAAHRWRAVLKAFPDINAFAAMAGQVFACAGDAEEAETVLDQAVEHDPVSIDLRTARAFVAQTSGNWTRAVERWNDVIRLAPDVPGFRMLLREAILRQQGKVGAGRADSQDADPDASASAADPEEKRRSLDAVTGGVSRHSLTEEELTVPMKDMVRQFESLGDNCEFGLVQRHHGAEPITLFRFVAIEPERLIELLDLDLGPLGDPDHTVVAERGNEYYVVDDRGYYWMHTFIRTQQAGAERYVKQQGARLGYLKRNFLQDLQSGEKIYVCKLSTAPISDATLMKLSGSLRRFGDNMLLGVRRADADHPPGSVERLDDHVLVGYMKSLQAEGDLGIHQESWEPVIRKVYRERSRRSAETRRDPALVPESMAV